jgi:hypothetical protein
MTAEIPSVPCGPAPRDNGQRPDESVVIDLVASARDGDAQAWDALVDRYAPLIWSICRKYRSDHAGYDWVTLPLSAGDNAFADCLSRSTICYNGPKFPGRGVG